MILDFGINSSSCIDIVSILNLILSFEERYLKKEGKGVAKKANPAKKTNPVKKITPQRLELLIKGYQTGNTSELIKREIIMGLNQMIKNKILTKKEVQRIRNNILL